MMLLRKNKKKMNMKKGLTKRNRKKTTMKSKRKNMKKKLIKSILILSSRIAWLQVSKLSLITLTSSNSVTEKIAS